MANLEIRDALKRHGLYLWQFADIIGVSEPTITRMMRHEIDEDEQKRMVSLIEEAMKRKNC